MDQNTSRSQIIITNLSLPTPLAIGLMAGFFGEGRMLGGVGRELGGSGVLGGVDWELGRSGVDWELGRSGVLGGVGRELGGGWGQWGVVGYK